MEAISFDEANSTLLGNELTLVEDLSVYKDGTQIISKWRMSWRERLSALLFGNVFVSVLASRTAPPMMVWAERQPFRADPSIPSVRSKREVADE